MVTHSMQLVSIVSDAVLELSLPDEEKISIRTSGTTFDLRRHTPSKLAGLPMEADGGGFVLPNKTEVLLSQIANTTYWYTQVKMYF